MTRRSHGRRSKTQPQGQSGLRPVEQLGMHSIAPARDDRRERKKQSNRLMWASILLTACIAGLGVGLSDFPLLAAVGLTLLAGLLQVLSVIVARNANPSEDNVRTQLLNAWQLCQRLDWLRVKTEQAYEVGNAEQRRRTLGETSATFTLLQDTATVNFYGWASIYPEMILDPPNAPQEGGNNA